MSALHGLFSIQKNPIAAKPGTCIRVLYFFDIKMFRAAMCIHTDGKYSSVIVPAGQTRTDSFICAPEKGHMSAACHIHID